VCKEKESKKKKQSSEVQIGPWIQKLHLADNGIDVTCSGDCDTPLANRSALLITCMQMIGK